MLWERENCMSSFIKTTGKTYDATPSYKLIKTMGFGSYTLETAVSDIVDNSITAKASRIDINFVWNKDISKCYVEIIDDGFGMNSKELEKAMIFAGKGIDDNRTDQDLGKYGLGMKTASFYACDCLTVISKKNNQAITGKRLDQQYIAEAQQWLGEDLDEAKELNSIHLTHGTIVRWDKLKFVDESVNSEVFFRERVNKIYNHIGIYFHRFIESKSLVITVNGAIVKPWNPTFKDNLGTNRIDIQDLQYKGGNIHVESYLLPSSLKLTEDETTKMYRNDALSYQGFYVYRNNRLLVGGGWLDIPKLTTHQQFNPVRITIDISSKLDNEFKVDYTKSKLTFPKEVEKQLYNIARMARSKASEAYKNRAKRVANPGIKSNDQVWNLTENSKGTFLKINEKHPLIIEYTQGIDKDNFKKLMKLLSTTIPQISKQVNEEIHFTDEEVKNMLLSYIAKELTKNKTPEEIYKQACNMEPFNDYLEIVQATFEEGGFLKND